MAATACGNGPSSPASVRSEDADANGTEQGGADAKATAANTTDSGADASGGDPGPDLISINLAVANGRTVIQLNASARANAPDDIFCQIQAIEASLTFQ